MFELIFSVEADEKLRSLEKLPVHAGLAKQIKKSLGFLSLNPRRPSLSTHEYSSIPDPYGTGQKVFGAYAQNNTPSAYRIFWCYGPGKRQITIIAITPHP